MKSVKNVTFKKIFAFIISLVITAQYVGAAQISDNDGGAFITKSEFDSLRSSFQSQINVYNTQIDSKIDTAIANYLSGVKVTNKVTNLLSSYVSQFGKNPVFANSLPGTGSDTNKGQVIVNLTREQCINKYSKITNDVYYYYLSDYARLRSGMYVGNAPAWEGSSSTWYNLWYVASGTTNADNGTTKGSSMSFNKAGAWNSGHSSVATDTVKQVYTAFAQTSVSGSGAGWIYQKINGANNLKYYNTSFYPVTTIDVWAHRYKNCASWTASYYVNSSGKSDTTSISATANKLTALGTNTGGTKYTGTNTNNGTYWKQIITKAEVNNGTNYTDYIFASIPTTQVYCFSEDIGLTTATTTTKATIDDQSFYDIYYTSLGGKLQTNTMSGVTMNYYAQSYTPELKQIKTFAISNLANLAGENVYHGEGFPLLRMENDTSCTATIKITGSTTGNITYKVSDKKLSGNAFQSSAKIKASGTVASGSTFTVSLNDCKKGTIIWINCYHATSGRTATLNSVEVSY